MAGIDEMKKGADNKTSNIEVKAPIVEKKKTISEKFLEEFTEEENEEKEIFLKIKGIRMDTCELEEFEAVTEESLEDYVKLITYIKNDKITFEEDGVRVKVRRPIKDSNGNVITNSLMVLYERNTDREGVFTKKLKIQKENINDSLNYSRAVLAASLANENNIIISPESITPSKIHSVDYGLLMTVQDFFRK
jgi:hypothetical protein